MCEKKYSYLLSSCPVQILHSDPAHSACTYNFTVRSRHWTTCVGRGHSLVSNAITDCFPKIIYIYTHTHTHTQLYIICVLSHFSHVQLFLELMDCSLPGFSRQEYWSGLPCPPPGELPDPKIEPTSVMYPALAGGFFTTSANWEDI